MNIAATKYRQRRKDGKNRYIVVFRRHGSQNVEVMQECLKTKVGEAPKKLAGIKGVTVLKKRSKDQLQTEVFQSLGVAAAELDEVEVEDLLADQEVRTVETDELRYVQVVGRYQGLGRSATARLYPWSSAQRIYPWNETPHICPWGACMEPRLISDPRVGGMGANRIYPWGAYPWDAPASPAMRKKSGSTTHGWALDMIGIHANYSVATGKGVKVAVLDTGVDLKHPDFKGRFKEGASDDAKATAVSFVEDEKVQDKNGHGTHTTGTVGGPLARDSSGGTRYGVAPHADLLVGKVLSDDGFGWDRDILAGIAWAADRGARVVSLSLGSFRQAGKPYARVYERVAGALYEQNPGVLLVAATGNDSERPSYVEAVGNPAACPSFLGVAALNADGSTAYFSNGQVDEVGHVDLSAPGVGVLSAATGGGYIELDGTSMATPHVSGVAALYLQSSPELTVMDLRNVLEIEAVRLGPSLDTGYGLVQAPGA